MQTKTLQEKGCKKTSRSKTISTHGISGLKKKNADMKKECKSSRKKNRVRR